MKSPRTPALATDARAYDAAREERGPRPGTAFGIRVPAAANSCFSLLLLGHRRRGCGDGRVKRHSKASCNENGQFGPRGQRTSG